MQPVINQVEFHPYLQQRKEAEHSRQHGIVWEAYTPLAPLLHKKNGPVDPIVQRLAAKHGKTAAEVLIRWNLQQGNVVITTSSKPDRLQEYLSTLDWSLTDEEAQEISEAGKQVHYRKGWSWSKHFVAYDAETQQSKI